MRKRIIIVSLMVLLFTDILVSCSSAESESESTDTGMTSTQDIEEQDESSSNSEYTDLDEEAQTEAQQDIVINTIYGDLYYPEQWAEYLTTTQKNSGDTIIISFKAEIAGNTYDMFEVIINGNEEDGTPVGEITDMDGNAWTVLLRMDEFSDLSELTGEEQTCLYAMQEDLNYLIDNLK